MAKKRQPIAHIASSRAHASTPSRALRRTGVTRLLDGRTRLHERPLVSGSDERGVFILATNAGEPQDHMAIDLDHYVGKHG